MFKRIGYVILVSILTLATDKLSWLTLSLSCVYGSDISQLPAITAGFRFELITL